MIFTQEREANNDNNKRKPKINTKKLILENLNAS